MKSHIFFSIYFFFFYYYILYYLKKKFFIVTEVRKVSSLSSYFFKIFEYRPYNVWRLLLFGWKVYNTILNNGKKDGAYLDGE